jgi:hypothetical protein
MATVALTQDIWRRLRTEADSPVEQVAFFLAHHDDGRFNAFDMRLISSADFDIQTGFHVALADRLRGELIRWAWTANASLLEAHSHVHGDPVCFSPTDLSGLRSWVPHVWWRLQGRPYAALVIGSETVDGLAWIAAADQAEQVVQVEVPGRAFIRTTGLSMQAASRRAA